MPRTKPEVVLTGEQEPTRAFVKGMVVGSLLFARADELMTNLGWKFSIREDGVAVFTAPSGDRYAVGVVKL